MNHYTFAIKIIINRRFTNPDFGVQMLADELGLSTAYVRELSWRECAMCPYTLIENKRLRKALSLMHDENLNLQQVCDKSGYKSPQTLRDALKKRFDMTPAEIRLKLYQESRRPLIMKSFIERLRNGLSKSA